MKAAIAIGAFASALGLACSSGGTAPTGNPEPLGQRDLPAVFRDIAASDRESPGGSTRDNPTTGGSGGGSAGCIACNTSYACTVIDNGKSEQVTLSVKSYPGWCGSKTGGLTCNGLVVDGNGARQGTWFAQPGGGFTACDLNGACTVTCVSAKAAPGSFGGDAG